MACTGRFAQKPLITRRFIQCDTSKRLNVSEQQGFDVRNKYFYFDVSELTTSVVAILCTPLTIAALISNSRNNHFQTILLITTRCTIVKFGNRRVDK